MFSGFSRFLSFLPCPCVAGLGPRRKTAKCPGEWWRLFQQHAAHDESAEGSDSGEGRLVECQ